MLKDKLRAMSTKEINLFGETVTVKLFNVARRQELLERLQREDLPDEEKLMPWFQSIVDEAGEPILDINFIRDELTTDAATQILHSVMQANGMDIDGKKN